MGEGQGGGGKHADIALLACSPSPLSPPPKGGEKNSWKGGMGGFSTIRQKDDSFLTAVLLIHNPRVQDSVKQVGYEVPHNGQHGNEQEAGLNQRVIAPLDRFDHEKPQARP